jgi:hypothetical protein
MMPGAVTHAPLGQSAGTATLHSWFLRGPASHILRKLLLTLAMGKPGHELIHNALGLFVPAEAVAVVESSSNSMSGEKSSATRKTIHPDGGMVNGVVKITTLIPGSRAIPPVTMSSMKTPSAS